MLWKSSSDSSSAVSSIGTSSEIRTQLAAFEVLEIEDVLVDRGRVVDDDDHLGVRVEVGPRLVRELLELVDVACVGHVISAIYPEIGPQTVLLAQALEIAQLPGDLGLDVEWFLALAHASLALRATTSWRTSSISAGSAVTSTVGVLIFRISSSTSSGSSPRLRWR